MFQKVFSKSFLFLSLLLVGWSVQAQKADPYQLRSEVLRSLTRTVGATPYAMLAELENGDLRAAIFWPWLQKDNGTPDDDIMAFIYKRSPGGGFSQLGRMYEVSHSDRDQFLVDFKAENGFTIHRPDAVGSAEVKSFISRSLDKVLAGWNAGSLEQMMYATENLARFFDIELCCWKDGVSEMVLEKISWLEYDFQLMDCGTDGKEQSCSFMIRMKSPENEKKSFGEVMLRKSDTGWLIYEGREEVN